eukprot:3916955-Pyramimonas_sp.AAC.1
MRTRVLLMRRSRTNMRTMSIMLGNMMKRMTMMSRMMNDEEEEEDEDDEDEGGWGCRRGI